MLKRECAGALLSTIVILGATVPAGTAPHDGTPIRLMSRALGRSGGDLGSHASAVSASGRFVMFWSNSRNLVKRDRNISSDAFVMDRTRGRVMRVSVDSRGREANGDTYYGGLSDDGRVAVFESRATNLVTDGPAPLAGVYMRDLRRRKTRLVAVAEDGTPANESYLDRGRCLSGDGRVVVFYSRATNLVPGADSGVNQVYLADLEAGNLLLVSANAEGEPGNQDCGTASVSANGRFVTYWSHATNLVAGDTNGVSDVFLYDREFASTRRVSVASDGADANDGSYFPAVSDDGLVVFHSEATNLVEGDSNASFDVFLHDPQGGTTDRLSVTANGGEVAGDSHHPAISRDGGTVIFATDADGLVPEDGNGKADIFVRDLVEGSVRLLSVGANGGGADGSSATGSAGALSSDGAWCAFDSLATNLVRRDRNGEVRDVFVAPTR